MSKKTINNELGTVLKNEDLDFLENRLHINLDHLMATLISKDIIKYKEQILAQIHGFIKLTSSKNKQCTDINKTFNEINNKKANIVLDSMRHAILSFCKGGLHDLWVYQENQNWYPKIILKDIIEPNDIDTLPDKLIIYRGCDISEIKDNKYRQAWTTSYKCAKEFAFTHYESEDWFINENRVIMKAEINKNGIYYSDQQDHEKEIVTETSRLQNIKLLEHTRI